MEDLVGSGGRPTLALFLFPSPSYYFIFLYFSFLSSSPCLLVRNSLSLYFSFLSSITLSPSLSLISLPLSFPVSLPFPSLHLYSTPTPFSSFINLSISVSQPSYLSIYLSTPSKTESPLPPRGGPTGLVSPCLPPSPGGQWSRNPSGLPLLGGGRGSHPHGYTILSLSL